MLAYLLYLIRICVLRPLRLTSPVHVVTHPSPSPLIATVLAKCPSLTSKTKAYFTPSILLSLIPYFKGHAHTIFAAKADFSHSDQIRYLRKYLRMPDGGTITLDFSPPTEEWDDRPTIVISHGLTGGSHESYVRCLAKNATDSRKSGGLGWRVCVVNSRGCGGSPMTSSKLYNAGYTDDLRSALLFLRNALPQGTPLYGVGFSLGANFQTKFVGEEGELAPYKAFSCIANPWDIHAGHVALCGSIFGWVYSQRMATNLRTLTYKHREAFLYPSNKVLDFTSLLGNPHQSLYEFDSIVTRVLGGFDSTEEYYKTQGSAQFAHNIKIPMLSLSSRDDPIATFDAIPFGAAKQNSNLVFAFTEFGGHLGWFTSVFTKHRWFVKPVLEFFDAMEIERPKQVLQTSSRRVVTVGQTVAVSDTVGYTLLHENEIVRGEDSSDVAAQGM